MCFFFIKMKSRFDQNYVILYSRFFYVTYTVLNASGIAISENLMKSVAEFPAHDLIAVEFEFDGIVPERQGALLEASA